MTPAETLVAQITADLAAAAAEHGWAPVAEQIRRQPEAGDATVLLCASAGAEPTARSLAVRLTCDHRGIEFPHRALPALFTDPWPAVNANRVIVVLGCAELLAPDAVAVATDLASRPAGTVRTLLTGAEVLTSPDDLELLSRRFWQILSAEPDVSWQGQDLESIGCLLHCADEPPAWLAERIASDAAALDAWLAETPQVPTALLIDRLGHLMALAEECADATAKPAGRAVSATCHELRELIEEARRSVLALLERAAEAVADDAAAGLATLERDLIGGLDRYLQRNKDQISDRGSAESLVVTHIDRAVSQWYAETAPGLRVRVARANLAVAELYQSLDSALTRSGAAAGLAGPAPSMNVDVLLRNPPSAAGRPHGRTGSRFPRTAIVGGALGAAAGALTGPLGTVLGAVGGAAAGRVVQHMRHEQQLALVGELGRRLITTRVANSTSALPPTLRREVLAMRATVADALDRVAQDLDARTADRPDPAPPERGQALLAALKARFAELR